MDIIKDLKDFRVSVDTSVLLMTLFPSVLYGLMVKM